MGKKKGVRVTVVVEDEALERFSRETLLTLGFSRREIRVASYPVGEGSGKDWVDKQYPGELRLLRSKRHQKLGLIVGTDADQMTVAERARRLATMLESEAVQGRADSERVAFWIPKWNVETWLLYFTGDARDEDNNYKNDVKKPDYRAAARTFVAEFREYKQGSAIETQPSLRSAYEETRRLGV